MADGWCPSSGSGFNALASNTIQCNWTWTEAPSPVAWNTLSSAEIMDLVPAPWPLCDLVFSIESLKLDYIADDNDWNATELPPTVCQRMQGVVDQIKDKLIADGSKDISESDVLMPPGLDEQWSCDTTWSWHYTGSGDGTVTTASLDIHCTIPGTNTQAWLVNDATGYQATLPWP